MTKKRKQSRARLRRIIVNRDQQIKNLCADLARVKDELEARGVQRASMTRQIHALETTRNHLRDECAALSANLSRAMGYIDAVTEEKRKPVERVTFDPPAPCGPQVGFLQPGDLHGRVHSSFNDDNQNQKSWWRV